MRSKNKKIQLNLALIQSSDQTLNLFLGLDAIRLGIRPGTTWFVSLSYKVRLCLHVKANRNRVDRIFLLSKRVPDRSELEFWCLRRSSQFLVDERCELTGSKEMINWEVQSVDELTNLGQKLITWWLNWVNIKINWNYGCPDRFCSVRFSFSVSLNLKKSEISNSLKLEYSHTPSETILKDNDGIS